MRKNVGNFDKKRFSSTSISNFAENGRQKRAAKILSQCSTCVRCTEFSFVEILAEKLSTKFAHFQPAWWMLIFSLSVCLEIYNVALRLSSSPTLYFRRGPPEGGPALPPVLYKSKFWAFLKSKWTIFYDCRCNPPRDLQNFIDQPNIPELKFSFAI